MLLRAIHIQDDRNRPARLFRLGVGQQWALHVLFPAKGRAADRQPSDRRARVIIAKTNSRQWNAMTWRHAGIIGTGLFAIVLLAPGWMWLASVRSLPVYAGIPGLWLVSLLVGLCLKAMIDRLHAPHVRAALLAERLCPSCAYDLVNTPRDPDGLTTCPECGAAWRV